MKRRPSVRFPSIRQESGMGYSGLLLLFELCIFAINVKCQRDGESFDDTGAGNRPPYAVYSKGGLGEEQSDRDSRTGQQDAHQSRNACFVVAVENSDIEQFQTHKYL